MVRIEEGDLTELKEIIERKINESQIIGITDQEIRELAQEAVNEFIEWLEN